MGGGALMVHRKHGRYIIRITNPDLYVPGFT